MARESRKRSKAGLEPLEVVADPISVAILHELGGSEIGADELIGRMRHTSRSTGFARLRRLEGIGLLGRETIASVPRRTRYRLTPAGEELLAIAGQVEAWLRGSPPNAGAPPAAVAVRALAMGWSTEILHRLGEHPRSLTELACRIDVLGYHRVRHALRTLQAADLIVPTRAADRSRPYRLTRFARRATGAIADAVRWEERHRPGDSPPLSAADAKAMLLLPAPLIELPAESSGTCTLCVEGFGQISLEISGGRVISWAATEQSAPNWLNGTRQQWRRALSGEGMAPLEAGGDRQLLESLLVGFEPYLAPTWTDPDSLGLSTSRL